MHIGLSDMAIFRYAKKWSYGFFSAFGMYLGHYLAWVCAGAMGAAVAATMNTPLTDLDAGDVAYQAAGWAGAIAVVIAGWTTANPTMYRAGLALQIATPNWPRWTVTLAAGVVTTIVACFPWVFRHLLDFVGIYGLAIMPIGAIVFVEHYLFPRFGLRRFWAGSQLFNWPAMITWAATILFCFLLSELGSHLFFLWLPGWFFAALAYVILAKVFGADRATVIEEPPPAPAPPPAAEATTPPNPMVMVLGGMLAVVMLVVMLGSAIYVFVSGAAGTAETQETYKESHELFKTWLWVPTILYFVGALMWTSQREKGKGQGTA